MKKFLVWLFCLILLTQPVFAQSEKLIILNTNTGQDTDTGTGQNAGAGEQNSSDTTENTDNGKYAGRREMWTYPHRLLF